MKSRRYSKRRYQKKTMRKKYLRKKTMRRKNLRRRKTMRRKKTRKKKKLLGGATGGSWWNMLGHTTRVKKAKQKQKKEIDSRVPNFDEDEDVQEILRPDGNDPIVRTGALDSLSGINKKGCGSQDVINANQLVTQAKEKLETEEKNLKETKQKNGCKTKKSFGSIFKRKSKQARADPIYED